MDTLEDRGMDRRLADRGGHGADPSEAKAVTQRYQAQPLFLPQETGVPQTRADLMAFVGYASGFLVSRSY